MNQSPKLPNTPAAGWGSAILGAVVGVGAALLGWGMLRKRETRRERGERFAYTVAAVEYFAQALALIHAGYFELADGCLERSERYAEHALVRTEGSTNVIEATAPHGSIVYDSERGEEWHAIGFEASWEQLQWLERQRKATLCYIAGHWLERAQAETAKLSLRPNVRGDGEGI